MHYALSSITALYHQTFGPWRPWQLGHIPVEIQAVFLLEYRGISEWQRYRYVANEGTLHLDHIYLDVMRSVIKKLYSMEAVMSLEELHHLSL